MYTHTHMQNTRTHTHSGIILFHVAECLTHDIRYLFFGAEHIMATYEWVVFFQHSRLKKAHFNRMAKSLIWQQPMFTPAYCSPTPRILFAAMPPIVYQYRYVLSLSEPFLSLCIFQGGNFRQPFVEDNKASPSLWLLFWGLSLPFFFSLSYLFSCFLFFLFFLFFFEWEWIFRRRRKIWRYIL